MKPAEAAVVLRRLARKAADTAPRSNGHAALKGMYLGALFALIEAMRLDFRDRRIGISSSYRRQLSTNLRLLADSKPSLKGQWLAGFYFNDGLYRLAAVNDRGLKLATGTIGRLNVPCLLKLAKAQGLQLQLGALQKVHGEVNRLKHDRDGLATGRSVSIDLAVTASREARHLL